MKAKAGRRPRQAVTATQLDDLAERLEVRIAKLKAIKAGMKQTHQKNVKMSLETALELVAQLNGICREGLDHLRKNSPVGEPRPWDKWDD